jgi:hypothetical protein
MNFAFINKTYDTSNFATYADFCLKDTSADIEDNLVGRGCIEKTSTQEERSKEGR